MNSRMRSALLAIWQAPQNILGLFIAKWNREYPRRHFQDKTVVFWGNDHAGMSLGNYIFIPFHSVESINDESSYSSSYVFRHEFSHTIQSRYLGPLYLFIIGLPSVLWSNVSVLKNMRSTYKISYYDFFVEKWASNLGNRFFAVAHTT